jgi:endogenous inhibitor of DNA gyrase (YacG/DUF329 family)
MKGQTRAQWPEFPFCSARCRLIDLGRWLGEGYRIAGGPAGEVVVETEDERYSP